MHKPINRKTLINIVFIILNIILVTSVLFSQIIPNRTDLHMQSFINILLSSLILAISIYFIVRKKYNSIIIIGLIINLLYLGLWIWFFISNKYALQTFKYNISNDFSDLTYPKVYNTIILCFIVSAISLFIAHKYKKYQKIVIVTISIFFIIVFAYYAQLVLIVRGTRECPTSWYDNQMPSLDGPNEPMDSQYFIFNGYHKKYNQMDVEWVSQFCNVSRPTIVH